MEQLNLPPGFRFHPTDEELVVHYLCKRSAHQRLPVPNLIAELNLYKHDPWDLPHRALFGEKEWYFFTPRDRKYPNGSRPNRAAGRGYWKATGADKPIVPKGFTKPVGIKKALVFYSGKAPRGVKTDWIMHEYRLADSVTNSKKGSLRLDDWVLCRLYNKKNNWEESKPSVGSDDSYVSDVVDEDMERILGQQSCREMEGCEVKMKKEETDWFMDFSFDELQNSFGGFGSSGAGTGFGSLCPDYLLQ